MPGETTIPDETTILNFRHLLERHDLTKAVFAAVAEHLEARGALLRGGTVVDATVGRTSCVATASLVEFWLVESALPQP